MQGVGGADCIWRHALRLPGVIAMLVYPGLRKLLSSKIQQLFNTAQFFAPLTHTAVPQRAATGTTGTFTRATTATFRDNEGVLRTVPAGCARFEGARFVRNLLTATTALATQNVTTEARTYILSFYGTGSVALTGTVTDSLAGTGANTRVYKTVTATAGTLTLTVTGSVTSAQLEDITGRTDQTTPSEYVSVGVESAPYYHGSMVDGVKCFPTDINGNPLTTMERHKPETTEINSTIQSNAFATAPWVDVSGAIPISQNVVGPDGAVSAWTFTDNGVGGFMGRYQEYSLTSGTAAAFGIFVKKTTGAQTNYPAIVVSTPTHMSGACLHRTNGTAAAVTGLVGRTAIANTIVVEDFNTDYWRVKFTFTPNSTGVWGLYVMPAFNADGTGVGDNTITGTAVFYGMQGRVSGTMVGSYIATTTIAVARDPDILKYSGGDVPNLKMISVGGRSSNITATAGMMVSLDNGTTASYQSTFFRGAKGLEKLCYEGYSGGAHQWIQDTAYTPGANTKAAFSVAVNDIKMSKDGVAQTPDTTATIPAATQLSVGHLAGLYQPNANIGPIYGWTRNPSQSELNAVTT